MSRESSGQTPIDHAIRETALDPSRSFIVEAPAGSGKTELLTRRYLRLLACVQAPEEVLAITFTRKAASEMRNRILKALAMPDDAEASRPIATLAREVRAVDAKHGWALLQHPARLRIMTIDALNQYLARQLPVLSGAGANLRIAQDSHALYAEAALRVAERLAERSDAAAAVARLLRHLDNRYDTFESLLAHELARREHWLDLGLMRFEWPALRERLERALRRAITDELGALCEQIPRDAHREIAELAAHAGLRLKEQGAISAILACEGLDQFPAGDPAVLEQWRGIAELLLTKSGEWRARIDKNVGFVPNDPAKRRMADLLERLGREPDLAAAVHRVRDLPDATYSDAQWRNLTDFLAVLKLAIAELEVVMRDRGEIDYAANAIAARRALGTADEPTDLALRLDYRLRHILVDEFQDTSRSQVELLALLTAGWNDGDGRTLFCVGDPMQSIYRFRDADVGLFLNFKREGLNDLRLTPLRLQVNFRSSAPVLDWVNATFERALPARDDPDRGAVAFARSEARADASAEGGVFVHAIVGDRDSARREEAQRIAELIAAKQRAQADVRVAVLVSNRLHLQFIVRELRERGIEFSAVEIDPLIERPAVQDLVALTRALVHLADRTAWLALLRAPWCGLSLADLHALCGEESFDAAIWTLLSDGPRLARLTEDARERVNRILPILRRSLSARGRIGLRECVERTWHALGGPATLGDRAALDDCQAFFERLALIERNGDLEDVTRIEELIEDLYAASGAARVELMTIHRAKGLEFDIVILPSLDAGARGDEPPLLRAWELPYTGGPSLVMAPIAPRGAEPDRIYAWLDRMEKERARFEKGRLLYVAATRAERELHLFGAVEPEGAPRANTFLHLLWPLVEHEFARVQTSTRFADSPAAADTICTRRLPLDWRPPAPQVFAGELRVPEVLDQELLHPEFEWVSETARHVGTLVHREIERLSRDATFKLAEARYLHELAELGVPQRLREAAASRVAQALSMMLADERGRFLLGRGELLREAASEYALSGVIDREIVNGVVDRTFIDRHGVRWIVDFKTSTHEGGGVDAFLASEVARYAPQLRRYAQLMRALRPGEVVKAALYFPLLGGWREVPVD